MHIVKKSRIFKVDPYLSAHRALWWCPRRSPESTLEGSCGVPSPPADEPARDRAVVWRTDGLRLRGDSTRVWKAIVEDHEQVGRTWSDDAMIKTVSIGHRAGPNDAYRLIIGWGNGIYEATK